MKQTNSHTYNDIYFVFKYEYKCSIHRQTEHLIFKFQKHSWKRILDQLKTGCSHYFYRISLRMDITPEDNISSPNKFNFVHFAFLLNKNFWTEHGLEYTDNLMPNFVKTKNVFTFTTYASGDTDARAIKAKVNVTWRRRKKRKISFSFCTTCASICSCFTNF